MSDEELTPGQADLAASGGEEPVQDAAPEENGVDAAEGENEDEDDLFGDGGDGASGGDGDEEEEQPASTRKLDDEELDSGDDEGRTDRVEAADAVEQDEEQHTYNFMDADIARHSVPEPSDGELYLLKVPRFLAFEPTAFSHKSFLAPTTDHHSKKAPSDHFSPFNTAMSTVRWRRSPANNAELQSNARILRWSDGSLTLQFANDPINQYTVNANMLAPPQINPPIPTPTSVKSKTKDFKESYTYLVAPYEDANVMRVTNKFTTALSVVPTANTTDEALEKLQNDLAAAATRGRDEKDQAISFIDVSEDPELRRQREEASHKERLRQQRARERHEMKERERAVRTVGRSGRSGLHLNDLDDGMDGGKRPAKQPKSGRRGLQRSGSSETDYGARGPGRPQDDYESDDFVVNSDEEVEVMEDDDDDDDGIVEEPRRRRNSPSPKRNREVEDDSEAEVVVSRKKRRVVDDDDEDE